MRADMNALISRALRILLAAAVCAAASGGVARAKSEPEIGAAEVKMGTEAAKEVAKQQKLSDNSKDLARLRAIGEKMAGVANKKEVQAIYGKAKVTPFDYTFDIVEEDDVNAFSVPGGHIYIYRGLLNFVESDHELAGVLAHEIVHAAHHHMVYLISKENQMAAALVAWAAVLAGGDLGNVFYGIHLYQIAKLNGYGMQAERDADQGAIYYMRETNYNPVGLLTFMERLSKRVELFDYGIYRSHPLNAERVRAAKKLLVDLGVRINRRETTNAVKAEVKTDKVNDQDVPGVYVDGKLIYRPAPEQDKTSEQRARETADAINKMLDADVQLYEVRVGNGGVAARNQALITVSEADAKLMGQTPAQVANGAGEAIKQVLWKQMVETIH